MQVEPLTPWWPRIELKIFVYAFAISVTILWYLGTKFDYGYFIIIFSLGSHNSTKKKSSNFQKNIRAN